MKLLILLYYWVKFRVKVAVLGLGFFYRFLILRFQKHYLRFVFFFLSSRNRKLRKEASDRAKNLGPDHQLAGGWSRMISGGIGDISPPSTIHDTSPQDNTALPSSAERASRIACGLSASTMVLKPDSGGEGRITLWGKDVHSNAASLDAWDAFCEFVMVTLNTLDGINFVEASWKRAAYHAPAVAGGSEPPSRVFPISNASSIYLPKKANTRGACANV